MQFLRYCFCGGIGVATDYSVYCILLMTFSLWYQLANVAGYVSGTFVSFCLNSKITFGVRNKLGYRLTIFFGVAAIGFLASAVMLWLCIDIMRIDGKIAKLLTFPIVLIIQFSINSRVTFNERLFSQS